MIDYLFSGKMTNWEEILLAVVLYCMIYSVIRFFVFLMPFFRWIIDRICYKHMVRKARDRYEDENMDYYEGAIRYGKH